MATLYDKILGCIAGSRVASAMAVPTEGWAYEEIEAKWGRLDRFLTQAELDDAKAEQAARAPTRLPKRQPMPTLRLFPQEPHRYMTGMTEDGIARQDLLVTAVLERRGRITVEDWAEVIKRDVPPEHHLYGYLRAQEDEYIFPMIRGEVPPCYAGMLSPWPATHGYTRSSHPIGIINAGNPWQASRDALDVGMLMFPRHGTGLWSAACYAAAIAEAMKSGASVDSIVAAAMAHGGRSMAEWINRVIEVADGLNDVYEARSALTEWFDGWQMCGEENVSVALAIFKMTRADPKASIVAGVNWGRDTDCIAAMAAGLSGALSGAQSIPAEWIATVDRATMESRDTLYHRSIEEIAMGLHGAVLSNIESIKQQIASLEP